MRDLPTTINRLIDARLSDAHTVTVAKITKLNATSINCQPVTARMVDGETIELPEFTDVIPLVLHGGGSSIRMKTAVGDYCVLFFAERALDHWWAGRDNLPPAEARMFDYSDAIAIVGVMPRAQELSLVDKITLTGDTALVGALDVTGAVDVNGDLSVTGDAAATGNVEGATFSAGGVAGVSGAFTTHDGTAVTVVNGLITGIV